MEKTIKQIKPHGGRLINRLVEGDAKNELIGRAHSLPVLQLNERELADLEMIAIGAMSPLEGFMTKDVYESVLETMHLPLGLPWTLPVTLATNPGDDTAYKEGQDVALKHSDKVLGVLHVESVWKPDKSAEAEKVLLTTDGAHPGVQYLESIGDTYLGGTLDVIEKPAHDILNDYRLSGQEQLEMAAFVIATARSVDVGEPDQDAFDMPVAGAECKLQASLYGLAQGAGYGKIQCLYFNLHGYLQVFVDYRHTGESSDDLY